jgi:hypothetical protein
MPHVHETDALAVVLTGQSHDFDYQSLNSQKNHVAKVGRSKCRYTNFKTLPNKEGGFKPAYRRNVVASCADGASGRRLG